MKIAWIVVLVLLVACDSDGVGPGAPRIASESIAVGSQAQDGVVGEVVSEGVAVLVSDNAGKPLGDFAVEWAVTAGAGSVTGGGKTDVDGIARATWTLGTAPGTQVVEARVGGLPAVPFTVTAAAGEPAALAIDHDAIAFDLPTDSLLLIASIVDEYGNAISAAEAVWTSSDSAVLAIDAQGVIRAAGGGTATITASADGFATSVTVSVDLPSFSVAFVDLDLVRDFMAFGLPLSPDHDNVAYELQTVDDSMAVRSVSPGRVEAIHYQEDTDDYEIFIRYSDSWLLSYDHVVAPHQEVGADVLPGDTLGLVAYFGNYQEGNTLYPMGRVELQVNYQGGREPELAWCPALFGTAEFNAAHEAAIARTNGATETCVKQTAQP